MPEGDVVWRTARRLASALAGRVLTVSDLRWPSLATVDLTGRSVDAVACRGKHLLIRTSGGVTVHSHLRMDGEWRVQTASIGLPRGGRGAAIRAVLGNPEWSAVGYRLGMLNVLPTAREERIIGHLGPDLLAADWDTAAATGNLIADPERPIGEALLDQRVLAGLGTFFMAETCFLAGVSPWTPVGECADPRAIVDVAHRLITASITGPVQTTTGDPRPGRRQWVHARAGQGCRRCGGPVRAAPVGVAPTERTAFWCPRCQPGPSPHRSASPVTSLRRPAPGRASPGH